MDCINRPCPSGIAGSNIAAGNLRPLAVAAERRLAASACALTLAEAGYSGLAIMQWYGLMASAGTSAATVERLNCEVNAVLAVPDVAENSGPLAPSLPVAAWSSSTAS